MRCAGCHCDNPADATFCGACGRALRTITARSHAPRPASDDVEHDGRADDLARPPSVPTLSSSLPPAPVDGAVAASDDVDDADRTFHAGDVIVGSYVVERQLGRGGMGAVYLATDRLSGQRVAVKVLPASLARERDIRERFVREARALAALDHPGIVPLVTFAQDGDDRFLVMKYVAGESLEALLARHGVLAPARATSIVRAMAEALDYAHAHGVVHRDIKPGNILIAEDGRVVIVDFGIARTSDGGRRVTETGMLMGTPQYMSPEQIVGAPVDGRADLYACGLVLYEMLAGAPPFDGERTFDILRAHVDETPLDVAVARAAMAPASDPIPDPLRATVGMLLEKDPARRPASGRALVAHLDGLATPAPPTTSPPAPTTSRPTTATPLRRQRQTSETPAAAYPDSPAAVDAEELEALTRPPRHPAWGAAGLLVGVGAVVASLAVLVDVGAASGGSDVEPVAAVDAGTPAGGARFEEAVLVARARVALDRGRLDDARIALETARQLAGDSPALRLTRAELHHASGDHDAALTALADVDPQALDDDGRARHARLRAALDAAVAAATTPAPPSPSPSPAPAPTKPTGAPPPSPAPPAADGRPRPSELDDDVLAAITSSSRDVVGACYADHVVSAHVDADDGDAPGGEVVLDVRIGADGRVVDARVKRTTVGEAPFHACVRDAVMAWRFPAFGGADDRITHTFNFRARR